MHAARASRDASNLRDASDRRYRPRGPPPAVDVLSCLISRPFLGASRPCTQRSGLAPLRGYSALKGATARRESSAATAAATPHELPNFVPFACFVVRPDTLRAACASSRLLRSEKIDCPSWILRGYSRSHTARTSQFRAFRVFRGHPDTPRASRSTAIPLRKIDCPSWILRGYSRSHITRTSQFRAFRVFRGHPDTLRGSRSTAIPLRKIDCSS